MSTAAAVKEDFDLEGYISNERKETTIPLWICIRIFFQVPLSHIPPPHKAFQTNTERAIMIHLISWIGLFNNYKPRTYYVPGTF